MKRNGVTAWERISASFSGWSLSYSDEFYKGLKAGSDILLSGGTITISQSYEGLAGSRILISGGSIDVTASDDRLNAAGTVSTLTVRFLPVPMAADLAGSGKYCKNLCRKKL